VKVTQWFRGKVADQYQAASLSLHLTDAAQGQERKHDALNL
jgi:hypothetical protein